MSASSEPVDKFEAAQLLINFQQHSLPVNPEAATSVVDVCHGNDEPSISVTASASSDANNHRDWSSSLRKAASVVLRGEMPKRWACNEYNVDFDDLEACLTSLREEEAAVNTNHQEEENEVPSGSTEPSDTVVAPTIFRCEKCNFVTSIEQSLEIHAASAHRETPATPVSKPRRSVTVGNAKQGKKTKEQANKQKGGWPVRSASLKVVVAKKRLGRTAKKGGARPKGGSHARELMIEVERVKQATTGRNTQRGSTTIKVYTLRTIDRKEQSILMF